VPEPTWLREIDRGMTVSELEAGSTLALPPAEMVRRDEAREAVEEIANNNPEVIAHQVAAWMKE
jgi:flagellar biosynthesis/type III secretory pathway M-ring protein FliF/YscJ